jgi:hypothetical protein
MILGKNSTWRPQLNSPPFDPKIGVSSSHGAALLISGFPAKPTLVAAPEAEAFWLLTNFSDEDKDQTHILLDFDFICKLLDFVLNTNFLDAFVSF